MARAPHTSLRDRVDLVQSRHHERRRVVAAIVAAKAMGKIAVVYGTGNCDTTQPTRELVAWIEFQ